MFKVTHAIYRENRMKSISTFCWQNTEFYTLKKVVNAVTTVFEGSNIAAHTHMYTNVM
jgi:hypothetical protein